MILEIKELNQKGRADCTKAEYGFINYNIFVNATNNLYIA